MNDHEMTSPAAWTETYGEVEQILREQGINGSSRLSGESGVASSG